MGSGPCGDVNVDTASAGRRRHSADDRPSRGSDSAKFTVARTPIAARALLIVVLLSSLSGCNRAWPADNKPGNPVEPAGLAGELSDRRLQRRLGVDEIAILESETYRVVIGSSITGETLGIMYYTIQDGWHLRADNEVMEFVRGRGWVIGEQ